MQRTLKKFVLLLMLVCAVVCCAVFAACAETPDDVQKVTYSVTVTTDDESLNLTSLKAQWLSGTDVKGEEALTAEGTASVELEEGNYTVTLNGVPTGYTFDTASVTAENPDATIAITKTSTSVPVTVMYTVTVTLGEEVEIDLTTVTAQWKKGNDVVESKALDAEGKATVELEEGNYTVALDGVGDDYLVPQANVTAAEPNATIEITKKPTFDTTAIYSVTVTAEAGFDFTGISAQWKLNGATLETVALNAEGTATVELGEAEYTVTLVGVPEGYEFNDATVNAENRDATIELTKKAPVVTTYIVNLTVAVPDGVVLEGAQVQIYNGEEAYGAPQAANAGSNIVMVPGGGYSVSIINLPDYLECNEKITITGSEAAVSVTINVVYAQIEYTVNVTADAGLTLAGASAVLYANDVEVASAELIDGVAHITATAGNYTVGLKNYNSEYEYVYGNVSIANRSANIHVTATTYTITIDVDATNINVSDLTALTAKLVAGSYVREANFNASGVATVVAAAGEYSIEIEGLSSTYKYVYAPVTADERATTVYVAENVSGSMYMYQDSTGDWLTTAASGSSFTLNKDGRFYLASTVNANGILVAPQIQLNGYESGLKTYTIRWDTSLYNVTYYDFDNDGHTENGPGYVEFVLNGDSVRFVLQVNYLGALTVGDMFPFIVTVECTEGPAEGSKNNPYYINSIAEMEGEHVAGEGVTDAYFVLPVYNTFNTLSYTIEYADGLEAYFLELGKDDTYEELKESGDWFTPYVNDGLDTNVSWLRVRTTNDTPIAFTLAIYTPPAAPGEAASSAIVITEEEEVGRLTESLLATTIWYSFTPVNSGDYLVVPVKNDDFTSVTIYKDYDAETDSMTQVGRATKSNAETTKFALTAGQTYLLEFAVGRDYGGIATFYIVSAANAPAGTINNPLEVTGVGADINTVNIATNGDDTYFKFVVTEDSLKDGKVIFQWVATYSSLYAYFYSDSSYTASIGTYYGTDSDPWSYATSVGATIYFRINGYGNTSVSFAINPAEDEGTKLGVNTPVTVDLIGSQYWFFSWEIELDNVPAGKYTLSMTSTSSVSQPDPLVIAFGSVSFNTSSFTFTSPEFELAANVTKMTINTNTWFAASPVTVTFTLKSAGGGNTDPTPAGLTVNGTYEADLSGNMATGRMTHEIPLVDVPAGEYDLKLVLATEIYNPIWVTIAGGTNEGMLGSSGTWSEATLTVTVGANAKVIELICNSFNYGDINHAVFTLIGEEPAPDGLTLNGEYSIELPQLSGMLNQDIPLVGVEAGTYTFKITSTAKIDFFIFATPAGGQEITIGNSGLFGMDPYTEISVEIKIPANCASINLFANQAWTDGPMTVTFALIGDEPVDGLTVGGTYSIELPQLSGMLNQDIPLAKVPAGTYTLTITSTAKIDFFIFATPAGGQEITIGNSGLFGMDPYTEISVTITIPANCESINLFANQAWTDGAMTVTFALAGEGGGSTNPGGNTDPIEPDAIVIEADNQEVTVEAEGYAEANVVLGDSVVDGNTYKLDISTGESLTIVVAYGLGFNDYEEIVTPGNYEHEYITFVADKSFGLGISVQASGEYFVFLKLTEATTGGGAAAQGPVDGQYQTENIEYNELEGMHMSLESAVMFHVNSDSSFNDSNPISFVITFEGDLTVIYYSQGYVMYNSFGWGNKIIANSGDSLEFYPVYSSDIYVYAPAGSFINFTLSGEGGSGTTDGTLENPREAVTGLNEFEPFSEVWYMYNVTEAGTFKFVWADTYNSTYANFYTNSNFESGSLGNIYEPGQSFEYAVQSGDIIYFHVESWGYGIETVGFMITVEADGGSVVEPVRYEVDLTEDIAAGTAILEEELVTITAVDSFSGRNTSSSITWKPEGSDEYVRFEDKHVQSGGGGGSSNRVAVLSFELADGYTYTIKMWTGSSSSSARKLVLNNVEKDTGTSTQFEMLEWTDLEAGTYELTQNGNAKFYKIVVIATPAEGGTTTPSEPETATFSFAFGSASTTAMNSTTAKGLFDHEYVTDVTVNSYVYAGNSSGGLATGNNFIKLGNGSNAGKITLTFSKAVAKVEVKCLAWSASEAGMVVNGASQNMSTTSNTPSTLTYELDPSTVVEISTSPKRGLIYEIVVYFEA